MLVLLGFFSLVSCLLDDVVVVYLFGCLFGVGVCFLWVLWTVWRCVLVVFVVFGGFGFVVVVGCCCVIVFVCLGTWFVAYCCVIGGLLLVFGCGGGYL